MVGGVYLIVDRFTVFVALFLFFGNWPCRPGCDMFIRHQSPVKITENCEGFVASTKRKFLYDDVMQVLSLTPPFFLSHLNF